MVSVFLTGPVDFPVGVPGITFAGRIGWRGSTITVFGFGAFGAFATGFVTGVGGWTFGSPTGPAGGAAGLAGITGIVAVGPAFGAASGPADVGFAPVASGGFVGAAPAGFAVFGAGLAFGSDFGPAVGCDATSDDPPFGQRFSGQ